MMNKKLICIIISLTTISFIGCTNKNTTSTDSGSNTASTPAKPIQIYNATEEQPTTLSLTDDSSYFCPFVFVQNDQILVFSDPADNNKFSTMPKLLLNDIIKITDVGEAANYSTDNITFANQNIYFADSSNNNSLVSFDTINKTYSKHNIHSVSNLIASNTDLFYLNKNDNNKIYKYDTVTSNSMLVCPDSVGSFIVSGDYIIYQNLSDNSKLYSIKTDGTNKEKLVSNKDNYDFTADSFVVLEGKLLFFNSSDNNNLYFFDPSTAHYSRLSIMNGSQLKIINKSLYFINGNDLNNLYSLSVDLKNLTVTYKPEISEGINEYYLTSAGIFYKPSINVNNYYFKKV